MRYGYGYGYTPAPAPVRPPSYGGGYYPVPAPTPAPTPTPAPVRPPSYGGGYYPIPAPIVPPPPQRPSPRPPMGRPGRRPVRRGLEVETSIASAALKSLAETDGLTSAAYRSGSGYGVVPVTMPVPTPTPAPYPIRGPIYGIGYSVYPVPVPTPSPLPSRRGRPGAGGRSGRRGSGYGVSPAPRRGGRYWLEADPITGPQTQAAAFQGRPDSVVQPGARLQGPFQECSPASGTEVDGSGRYARYALAPDGPSPYSLIAYQPTSADPLGRHRFDGPTLGCSQA